MMKRVFVLGLCSMMVMLLSFNQQKKNPASDDRGKDVYAKYCLSCHQENGAGVPRINPTLRRSAYVLGSKTKLIKIVLLGSDALTDDPDRSYMNPMAPIPNLTDQQIADVLTYVRKNFGNKSSGITPGDVRFVRGRL